MALPIMRPMWWPKRDVFEEIDVEKGTPCKVNAVAAERITALVSKGETESVVTKATIDKKSSYLLSKEMR